MRSPWLKKFTPHLLLQTPCPFTWCPVLQTLLSPPSPMVHQTCLFCCFHNRSSICSRNLSRNLNLSYQGNSGVHSRSTWSFSFSFSLFFTYHLRLSKSISATHNLQDFTLGDPVWYIEPPTLPLRPQDVLTHVHPIERMLHLPPGPSRTPPISSLAPLPPIETGGKATKATTNTIYMIASTSHPY